MTNESITASRTEHHRGFESHRPFETRELLDAVDAIDHLRDVLNDPQNGSPPKLRMDLLRLHQRATSVVNCQCDDNEREAFFDDATDIADQIAEMTGWLGRIEVTLHRLADMSPI